MSYGFLDIALTPRVRAAQAAIGNRQYISLGNLTATNRICMFLVDYPGALG